MGTPLETRNANTRPPEALTRYVESSPVEILRSDPAVPKSFSESLAMSVSIYAVQQIGVRGRRR